MTISEGTRYTPESAYPVHTPAGTLVSSILPLNEGQIISIHPIAKNHGGTSVIHTTTDENTYIKICNTALSIEQASTIFPDIQADVEMIDMDTVPYEKLVPQIEDNEQNNHQTEAFRATLRFMREAHIVTKHIPQDASIHTPDIQHFYLLRLKHSNEYVPAFLMERLSDDSLSDKLKPGLSPDRKLRYLIKLDRVAKTLDLLHDAGIIHRDVKPKNILRYKDKGFILTDYGSARYNDHTLHKGLISGTPDYMAPEENDKRDTGATDQFALAITIGNILLDGEDPRIWTGRTGNGPAFPEKPYDFFVQVICKNIHVDVQNLSGRIAEAMHPHSPFETRYDRSLAEILHTATEYEAINRLYNCVLLQKLTTDTLTENVAAAVLGHIAYLMRRDQKNQAVQEETQAFVEYYQTIPNAKFYARELFTTVTSDSISEGDELQAVLWLLAAPPKEFIADDTIL